ncbi:nuclear transcription factor Y subunit B-3-like [Lotus japonicus]|uniref:nuclear transcription factor Y subunit B-3-like n=1 Tax=Lotus japonicus TaxID=34305 RepID=UPI00258E1F07|nr:nuclear transcription factor Y subunit B-3-like [Lotus japonicus]
MAESDKEIGGKNELTSPNGCRELERLLPIANVSRIMKKALPGNAKISKEAKETMQECLSEFISFITAEASDKCQNEKRKTINGDDLVWAMTTLGFEDYVQALKGYLHKYRDMEGEKTNYSFIGRQQQNQQGDDDAVGSGVSMPSSSTSYHHQGVMYASGNVWKS